MMQEAVQNLVEAIAEWFQKTFGGDSGIVAAIEEIIKQIIAGYVDA
ncbi:MAG: hypothetical protein LBQ80_00590 [Clostridium sp.]|jgi:hypothetical protein|nr:hypothetical protein [Clostridium sp.]